MRKLSLLAALAALSSVGFAQYPAQGVRLLSHIGLAQFPGSPTSAAAIYGYVSPSGREYATVGLRNGTAIVEITNPTTPVTVAHIPGPNSLWHENVVLGQYCYSISDSSGAIGIQIINLSNVDAGTVTLDATYNGSAVSKNLSNVHTIEADIPTKRLFANGSNRGMVIFDATNPTNIVEVGRWTAAYVHDSVIHNYTSGPYAGKQIVFACCGGSGLYVLDVTNPASIQVLGSSPIWVNGGSNTYAHSASLTADERYLLINDEFDENRGLTTSATTIVFDVANLSAPVRAGQFVSGVPTIDHNSNLRDGFLYLSAYKAGVRIYDVSNPLAITQTGFLDTYPSATDANSYNGDWGVFAQFPSRNIVLSDIDDGFFCADPTEALGMGAPITGVFLDKATGSADAKNLRTADGNEAVLGPLGPRSLMFRTKHQTTYSPATSVDVSVVGRGVGTLRVWLKNVSTGQFQAVALRNLSPSANTTVTVTGLAPAQYIDSTGTIEVRLEVKAESLAPSFTCDVVKVKVNH